MANFLFCSLDAAFIGDVAWQVHREGHDVKYYIDAASDQDIADGFVPKTDDWRSEFDWADVVIFDTEDGRPPDGVHIEDAKRVSVSGSKGPPKATERRRERA